MTKREWRVRVNGWDRWEPTRAGAVDLVRFECWWAKAHAKEGK